MTEPIVIVGSGLAGYTLAREYRKYNKDAPLMVVTRDGGAFYSKPMLSNAFTHGKTPAELAIIGAQDMAVQLNGQVMPHATLTEIIPHKHTIRVQDQTGSARDIAYSKLALALGADPVHISVTGDGADHIFSVNDLDDYTRFRAALDQGQRVAILGGGLVGCEFANDLCTAKKTVHVIEPNHGPLARFLPEAGQQALKNALAAVGVNWHLGSMLAAVHHTGSALRIVLKKADATGEHIEFDVDFVLSAVGLRPRVHLAEHAGIKVNHGIVVDRLLRTSAPDIFALGDCAVVDGLSLNFVQPLMCAARALAKTLAGEETSVVYPPMPILVKTPAYPIIVLPPRPDWVGEWSVEVKPDGVKALFTDPNGWVRGFALTGAATAEKNALVKKVPGYIE